MADWNQPTNASLYTNVLANLKDRDTDAGTLFLSAPTNPVTGMIRYNRSTDLFEEYNGSSWVAIPISLAGGGTGAATAADARTGLGLGTLATQNSNAINVTGGTISGLTSLGVSGNIAASGTVSGTVANASTTATSNNTANAIVARDASGNFSAGTVTAALNGNAATATSATNASTVTNGVYTNVSYDNPVWLAGLSASKLNSGTVADARLSSNVALKGSVNTWGDYQLTAEPLKKYAANYSGGTIALTASTEREIFAGDSLTILNERGVNQILAPSTLGAQVLVSGIYLISCHLTFISSSADANYRMRIVSYASNVYSPSQIIARSETFCKDASKYIVLSCTGMVSVTTSTYIGVVAFSDKTATLTSFANEANNAITICRIG